MSKMDKPKKKQLVVKATAVKEIPQGKKIVQKDY
jgi:hypothetical protein